MHRVEPRFRPSLAAALAASLAMGLVTGCASPPRGTETVPEAPAPPVAAVDAAAVVARHNGRVALLARFHTRGVIELRWTDDDGAEHFEPQINARFWVHQPRRTALRGEKLGEVLFWLGSDADRFWMFDLLGEPHRLVVGRHDDPPDVSDLSLPVRPLALLPLSGLVAVPDGAETALAVGATGAVVVASFDVAGESLRLHLDAATALPVRAECLDHAGQVRLSSILSRPRSVNIAGISRAALPRTPTLIDIADADARLEIKLALGDADDQVPARLFDLDRLREAMPVERTEGLLE